MRFFIFYFCLIFSATAYAGSLDSPAAPNDPASASFTSNDLWNRMNAGTVGSMSVFTQPTAGPSAGTGHTLNEIMGIAPVPDNTNGAGLPDVLSGKTFWGLRTDGTGAQDWNSFY